MRVSSLIAPDCRATLSPRWREPDLGYALSHSAANTTSCCPRSTISSKACCTPSPIRGFHSWGCTLPDESTGELKRVPTLYFRLSAKGILVHPLTSQMHFRRPCSLASGRWPPITGKAGWEKFTAPGISGPSHGRCRNCCRPSWSKTFNPEAQACVLRHLTVPESYWTISILFIRIEFF